MEHYNPIIDAYMRRLGDLGNEQDHLGRFYVALHDEELRNLEEQLNVADEGLALHQPVLDLYDRWKSEMGSAKWAEVWTYNESLSDADRNWLVSEEMSDESTATSRST